MADYSMDLTNRLNSVSGYPELKNSTSRKQDPSELDLTDFLTLMVVQLQNQSIDSTMDTSDMLNQMVQMQMVTALTNMTDSSILSYASSLVGKEVTIGDYSSGTLVEKVVTITGSGISNGEYVIFAGNDVYKLSSVMAVGRLPEKVEEPEEGEGTDKPGEGGETPPVEGTDEPTDKPVEGTDEPTDKPVEGTGEPSDQPTEGTGEPSDKPVEGTEGPAGGTDKPVEGGDKPVEGTDEPAGDSGKLEEEDGVDPVIGAEQA